MPLILVTYDLYQGTTNEYAHLYAELKQTSWWHYLESVWIIATNETPNQVQQRLLPHLDPADRLFVCRIGERQGWLPKKAWEWLVRMSA